MASLFKSMVAWILICLEISSFLTSTMANDDYSGFGQGSTKRLCGRMLVDALALICNGEYEQIIHPSKRSDGMYDDAYYNDQPSTSIDELPRQYQSYAYLSKLVPDAPAIRVRRDWVARRGAYDECCRKPCSYYELKSFCRQKN